MKGAVMVLVAAVLGAGVGCAPAMHAPPGSVSPASEPPGRAPATTTTPAERQQVLDAERAARRAEQELRAARLDGPTASCQRACLLQATICELAVRICGIASAHTDDADLAMRCSDGRYRCSRARQTVAPRCQCGLG